MIEPRRWSTTCPLVMFAVLSPAVSGGCRWDQAATAAPPQFSAARKAGGTDAGIVGDIPRKDRQIAQSSELFGFASFPAAFEPVVEPRPWKYIVLHHSATKEGSVESIDAAHRERTDASGKPWLGIGYHFVIGNGRGMTDGLVEPTFRWREQLQGAHAGSRKYNEEGIGICVIGDFSDTEPTPRQTAAARQLIARLSQRYNIRVERVLRHSDIQASQCPGDCFPWEAVVPAELPTLKEYDRQ